MDSLILAIIILFLVVLPVLGLVFFIRSLIKKENIGCGIVGLLPFILVVSIPAYIIYSLSHISDSDFIKQFERETGIAFPPSGKIIEKEYQDGYLDWHCAAIILMDTLDYMKILREAQSSVEKRTERTDTLDLELLRELQSETVLSSISERASSFLLQKRFPAEECAYFHAYNSKPSLWFHKNKRIIVYQKRND
jgi:hypothetical protein